MRKQRAHRLILPLTVLLVLGACAEQSGKTYFDGKYYPAKGKAVKGDRERFVVSVRKAGQGIDGAREAGRHAGVTYCIENFGLSDIIWEKGPDAEDGTLVVEGGNLVLTGKCVVW